MLFTTDQTAGGDPTLWTLVLPLRFFADFTHDYWWINIHVNLLLEVDYFPTNSKSSQKYGAKYEYDSKLDLKLISIIISC